MLQTMICVFKLRRVHALPVNPSEMGKKMDGSGKEEEMYEASSD